MEKLEVKGEKERRMVTYFKGINDGKTGWGTAKNEERLLWVTGWEPLQQEERRGRGDCRAERSLRGERGRGHAGRCLRDQTRSRNLIGGVMQKHKRYKGECQETFTAAEGRGFKRLSAEKGVKTNGDPGIGIDRAGIAGAWGRLKGARAP